MKGTNHASHNDARSCSLIYSKFSLDAPTRLTRFSLLHSVHPTLKDLIIAKRKERCNLLSHAQSYHLDENTSRVHLLVMQVPESLKFVRPYAQRAAEVEQSHPLIAYFCRMQMISKIIALQAHNRDADAAKYAEELMTQLESYRKDPEVPAEDRDILESEEKSAEYVRTFAKGVFLRAQKQISDHTVNQRTAMTLLAAATFLELVELWPGHSEAENVKFSKYHASRIMKAIKEGNDPNDLFEQDLEEELDRDLRDLENQKTEEMRAITPIDESDESGKNDGAIDGMDGGEVKVEDGATKTGGEASKELPNTPKEEPKAQPADADNAGKTLPHAPGDLPGVELPKTPNKEPNNLGLPQAPESQPGVVFEYEQPPKAPSLDEFNSQRAASPKPVPQVASTAPPPAKTNVRSILSQAEVTKSAQKHAKFAISALNYDDFNTAISELESALELLKAEQLQAHDH